MTVHVREDSESLHSAAGEPDSVGQRDSQAMPDSTEGAPRSEDALLLQPGVFTDSFQHRPDPTHQLRKLTVSYGDRELSVVDFLKQCELSLRSGETRGDETLITARNLFLAGGLPALRLMSAPTCWIQFGLAIESGMPVFYAELLQLARDCLLHLDAQNFFYMHKPPGVRIRFEVRSQHRADVQRRLATKIGSLALNHIVIRASPGVYEPEAHLFGGPISMACVHRLFTADSLAWLGYHRLRAADSHPGPSWAFSLALLGILFNAMGIEGWEDRDVWDRVRWQTGRRLSADHRAIDGFSHIADAVRHAWNNQELLRKQLSSETIPLLEAYSAAAADETAQWHTDYFTTSGAYVGPREATAFYIAYHWNRGGLTDIRQATIAESLARAATK